jgi:hypothetical protein
MASLYLDCNEGLLSLSAACESMIIIGPVVASLEWRHPPEDLAKLLRDQVAALADFEARSKGLCRGAPRGTEAAR